MTANSRHGGSCLLDRERTLLLLLAIIIVGIALSYAIFYGPSQMDSDNYEYVSYGHMVASGHASVLMDNGILGNKLILNYGIGIFMYLFGQTPFGASIFSEVCFLLTIVIIYALGSELHSKNAGLISAFTYAIMPISVVNASATSDAIPMALFTTAAIYAIIMATKIKPKSHSKTLALAALSGMLPTLGFLITAESLIILLPVLILAVYYTIKKGAANKPELLPGIFLGIAIGISLIAIWGYALSGTPLKAYSIDSTWYSSFPPPNLLYVVKLNIISIAPLYLLPHAAPKLPNPYWNYFYVWFVYVAIIFTVIMVFRRRNGYAIPSMWALVTFMYLSFGTMSLHKYIPIPPFPRYTLIFAPAIALLIGIGAADIITKKRIAKNNRSKTQKTKMLTRKRKTIATALLLIAIFSILLAQSLYSIYSLKSSEASATAPLLKVVHFIDQHGAANKTVQSLNIIPLQVYEGFRSPYVQVNMLNLNCSIMDSSMYFVSATNSSILDICGGMRIAAGPFNITDRENNLLLFDGIARSYGNGSISVYEPLHRN